MSGTNNDLVGSLVNDFFTQAGVQKEAADQTNPQGAGSEKLKEKKTGHEIEEVSGDNTLAAEDDRGAEMEADLKDSEMGAVKGNAQLAADNGAQVKEEDEVKHPQDNPQSPQQLNADESVKMDGDNVNVTQVTTTHAAPSEIAKVARAERLSTALLTTISQLNFSDEAHENAETFQKEATQRAATEGEPSVLRKFASEADEDVLNSFLAYSAGFERGLQKKAEDIGEVMEAGIAPDEGEAAALLDATAVQNPEAVLPPEAQPEADMSPEDMQALDELASELDAQGISPEQLMEAQAEIDAIKAETGATDEEIIQVLQEEASGAAVEEAPVEEEVPVEIPKVASENADASRRSILLDTLSKLTSNKQ
jgi:hypothetical protein